MQGKQAKIVSPTQERAILGFLDTTRYPSRDRVMFLFVTSTIKWPSMFSTISWHFVTLPIGLQSLEAYLCK